MNDGEVSLFVDAVKSSEPKRVKWCGLSDNLNLSH